MTGSTGVQAFALFRRSTLVHHFTAHPHIRCRASSCTSSIHFRIISICANNIVLQNEGRISVESEDEPERSLLEVKVKKEDNYQKQQGQPHRRNISNLSLFAVDTLIVWTDPDGIDMALSFQEAEGCGVVWLVV